jgi:hypothetical protein
MLKLLFVDVVFEYKCNRNIYRVIFLNENPMNSMYEGRMVVLNENPKQCE